MTPDDFRAYLAGGHPVPANFQREHVRVRAVEDPNRISYVVVDRERSHNILLDNVTRIEAWYAIGASAPAAEVVVARAAGGLWDRGLAVGTALAHGNFGGALSALGGAAGIAVGAPLEAVPKVNLSLVVRAWGNRNANRASLILAVGHVLRAKVPFFFGEGPLGLPNFAFYDINNAQIRADLMGRYVEAILDLGVPPGNRTLSLLMAQGTIIDRLRPFIEDNNGQAATTEERPGRAFVPSRTDRGTYLENAVAQVLWTGNVNPPAPTATPRTQDKKTVVY